MDNNCNEHATFFVLNFFVYLHFYKYIVLYCTQTHTPCIFWFKPMVEHIETHHKAANKQKHFIEKKSFQIFNKKSKERRKKNDEKFNQVQKFYIKQQTQPEQEDDVNKMMMNQEADSVEWLCRGWF